MSVKEPLEEILEELKAAEERWQMLLEESVNNTEHLKKPDILHAGPKQITKFKLPRKEREPFVPVVPIPKIKRNRDDFVSRMKTQLNLLKNELSWTVCAARKKVLIQSITNIKLEIKTFKRNKKHGKHPDKN